MIEISNIEDGYAFNCYDNKEITAEIVERTNAELQKAIAKGAEIKRYADPHKKGFYWWECLGHKIPCGGTHLSDLKEIGEVDIEYAPTKKGKATITIKLK